MNVGIGTVAAQFLFWEYLFSNFRYCVFAVLSMAGEGTLLRVKHGAGEGTLLIVAHGL
jgi:hypothetical protein